MITAYHFAPYPFPFNQCPLARLPAAVFTIILGTLGCSFTDFALALQWYGFANILPQTINIIAAVLAAIACQRC